MTGKEIGDSPLMADRAKMGFTGVYSNFVGGLGEAITKIDAFVLKEEN